MATAHDVAAFILQYHGTTTTMKLQKLLYYAQAWSLVWDEKPIFREQIQAWANGPVVRSIYESHREAFRVNQWIEGDVNNLSPTQQETTQLVVDFYGQHDLQWLSDLTHMEDPWKLARVGIPVGARSEAVITHSSMAEYYQSIQPNQAE